MSKMGSHDPFGHIKHKLWPKEGPVVKLPIWLPTTKSWEVPRFPCVQVACYILLKSSWQGLQLFLKLHLNRRFAWKVIGPQSCRSRDFGNFKMTKWHLGAIPMAMHKVYYKGEVGVFPQVQAVVNLVSLCLPVVRSCILILH